MDLTAWQDIVAIVAALAAAYAVLRGESTKRQSADVQQASGIINGYNALCTNLQNRLVTMNARISKMETELEEARKLNDALDARVKSLESQLYDAVMERDRLREQIKELQGA